jgi:DNA polymerase-3 subunit epsilon
MTPALVLDTETTGLVSNHTIKLDRQPELIEFYGCLVDLDTGEILKEIDTLVKPKVLTLPDKIKQITGITEAMLGNAPAFSSIAGDIKELIESSPVVVAHNASFDQEMMDIEFERIGQTVDWPPLVCTVEQSVHLKGYRLNLGDLHEHFFGERFKDAHRAKHDVAALVRCCCEMHKFEMLL